MQAGRREVLAFADTWHMQERSAPSIMHGMADAPMLPFTCLATSPADPSADGYMIFPPQ